MPFPEKISRRGWSYWLVYPTERRMVPKIKRFREWLLSEMGRAHAEAAALLASATVDMPAEARVA